MTNSINMKMEFHIKISKYYIKYVNCNFFNNSNFESYLLNLEHNFL